MTFISPIVGAHFRPPAKAILAELPGYAPLRLRREPGNPYDSNAMAVEVAGSEIRKIGDALEEAAANCGLTIEELCAEPFRHLGYIPAKEMAEIAAQIDHLANAGGIDTADAVLWGSLTYTARGAPAVAWDPSGTPESASAGATDDDGDEASEDDDFGGDDDDEYED